ncbi:MAG: shikimate dehydrogenase [Alphaproteobacteria bacterium]
MPPEISGHTRLYGIVADPIHHVRTPQRLNALMRERGFDGVMVPIQVAAPDLPRLIDTLRLLPNFGGFVATVPHKSAIPALCDETSERCRAIGAANLVRRDPDGRMIADMLDGEGFVAGLRAAGIEPAGRSAYLAGAGGAGSAIAFALAAAGVARLTLHNRTAARASALAERVAAFRPGVPVAVGTADPAGHDLVVNATSLGLSPDDPLPFDCGRLDPRMVAAEIIMQPEVTPMMARAAAAGCRTHPGMPMLASQLEMMMDFLRMSA